MESDKEKIVDGWGYPINCNIPKKHFFIEGTSMCDKHHSGATFIFRKPNLGCNVCKLCLKKTQEIIDKNE